MTTYTLDAGIAERLRLVLGRTAADEWDSAAAEGEYAGALAATRRLERERARRDAEFARRFSPLD